MKKMRELFIFQHYGAYADTVSETVSLFKQETPELIEPNFWPFNSSYLSPVKHGIWVVMQ